ncbi:MAG: hypothetical protein JWP37_3750 [Mucilaginibacter sp.]|nr:hypothetical protein [Mucilaginibacter sp.]
MQQSGLNDSERYLAKLCRGTFLSLWSFSNLFRQPGHELCDLLVACGDDIVIFSDKFCQYPDTGNTTLDWSRWFRSAVSKSATQLWGAEKWLRRDASRVFTDSACKIPLRVPIEITENTRFHLVLVAHGSSEACRQTYTGSGSLIIDTRLKDIEAHTQPFTIGDLDNAQTFIHILDDNALDIVLQKQDTIADFTHYLTKREQLLRGVKIIYSPGEEELLAFYLRHLNDADEHDFALPETDADAYVFDEGTWTAFENDPQRQRQIAADNISYFWDHLIEKFSFHTINDSQYYVSEGGYSDGEKLIRILAQERRLSRRALAESLADMIATTPKDRRRIRVMSTLRDHLYYAVLLLPYNEKFYQYDYDLYRQYRRTLLEITVFITRLKYTDAEHVIGIAMESGIEPTASSEDLLYFDCSGWNDEIEKQAMKDQKEFGILQSPSYIEIDIKEFPE